MKIKEHNKPEKNSELSDNLNKKYFLFNPGPVMISEKVRKKLLLPDICHREIEFSNLFDKISKNLNNVFRGNQEFTSLVLTGSGTCAMETIISSCIRNKVLLISNGAFGERWIDIASRYNIKHEALKYNWGKYPNLDDIEKILKNDDEIDSIISVHTETSTGMLNPITQIGKLAKEYNKLFLVDAICSLAIDDLDVVRDNIDFCVSSSNKGIGSIPGVSFICLRKSAYNFIKDIKPRNYYCDIRKYFDFKIDSSQVPMTPAIQAFYALDEALDILIDEGVEKRIIKTKYFSDLIRKSLSKTVFKFYLKNHFSNGITNIIIPPNSSYNMIHNYLKKKGFIIYGGKGKLKNKIFQISTIGINKKEIILNFINEIKNLENNLKRI